METVKKLLTTNRKVKLFDRQGKLWEEIEIPVSVLGGGVLHKIVAMGEKVFTRHGEEYHECSSSEFYRAPLPYLVGF
jgi:hypothetical protein